jgi:hypothetical protein
MPRPARLEAESRRERPLVRPTLSATRSTSALPERDTRSSPSAATSTLNGRPACVTFMAIPQSWSF